MSPGEEAARAIQWIVPVVALVVWLNPQLAHGVRFDGFWTQLIVVGGVFVAAPLVPVIACRKSRSLGATLLSILVSGFFVINMGLAIFGWFFWRGFSLD